MTGPINSFSDGLEADQVSFNAEAMATATVAEGKAR
jgi:hypothetical protein